MERAYRRLKEYLTETPLWARTHAGVLGSKPVAYFSLEFGVHESVPIYSGGLGVLSGDHIKSASGLGVPLVAIGLFYDQGYFKQHLDCNGWQQEEYLDTKVENLPMEPARGRRRQTDHRGDPDPHRPPVGQGLADARRPGAASTCWTATWKATAPRTASSPPGSMAATTARGSARSWWPAWAACARLRALGIQPGVYHLNEGHSAFATLEAIRERMKDNGLSFDDALRDVAQHTVFTTHTPVPAGHDRFDRNLIEEHLGPLRDELGDLARAVDGPGPGRAAERARAVLHDRAGPEALAAGQRREQPARPRHAADVGPPLALARRGGDPHRPHHQRRARRSWLAWQMQQLYDRHFPADWTSRMGEPEVWQRIHNVDPGELWETHHAPEEPAAWRSSAAASAGSAAAAARATRSSRPPATSSIPTSSPSASPGDSPPTSGPT